MESSVRSRPSSEGGGIVRDYVIKQTASQVLPTSNRSVDDELITELNSRALPPPYDPFQLAILAETSSVLSQCIDTMEVNIDSFGFELKPSVDDETFAELEKTAKKEIDDEYRRVINFFKYCNRRLSYIQIRRRTRRDYELLGNGYWEILRNHVTGKVTGIEWLPGYTMRIGRIDRKFTNCMVKVKTSDTMIELIPDKNRFRRYAQIKENVRLPIWFKEYGDPRLMDAETGGRARIERNKNGVVTDIIPEEETGFPPFNISKFKSGEMILATEVLHFCNFKSPKNLPYGTPRWIGNLISVIGSRTSEEVNMLYFENKTVPPGMLLVSGGRLTENTVDRITNHIKENVKGEKNFHSILVVEANKDMNPNLPNAGVPTLQWVSMRDAQQKDALFQNYDQNNIDKIISSFRFWSGYISRTKEINVATAEVAKQLSEEQVFQPEREEFDSIINRTIMIDLDVNYWEHKSKGPQLTSPKAIVEMLDKAKPFLTGDEGRQICSSVFGRDLEEIKDDWSKKPLTLVIAELTKALHETDKLLERAKDETGEKQLPKSKEDKVKEEIEKASARAEDEDEAIEFVKKIMAVRKALGQIKAEADENFMRGHVNA